MKTIAVFEFDKIIRIAPTPNPQDISEACYSTLPRAAFKPAAQRAILPLRRTADFVILSAPGNDRIVKECLWILGACKWFDIISIPSERLPECRNPYNPITKFTGASSQRIRWKPFEFGYLLMLEEQSADP